MSRIRRLLPWSLLAVAGLAVGAAVDHAWAGWKYGSLHPAPQSSRPNPDDASYRAYGEGFDKGLRQGHQDAQIEQDTQRELKAMRDRDARKMPPADD